MSTREAIAAALSTVPGVIGQAAPPDPILPGIGWPQWVSASPDTYGGMRATWYVLLALPNPDRITTIDAADPLVDLVWAALLDIGEVAIVEPVTISVADPAVSGQDVPALRFTLYTSGERT